MANAHTEAILSEVSGVARKWILRDLPTPQARAELGRQLMPPGEVEAYRLSPADLEQIGAIAFTQMVDMATSPHIVRLLVMAAYTGIKGDLHNVSMSLLSAAVSIPFDNEETDYPAAKMLTLLAELAKKKGMIDDTTIDAICQGLSLEKPDKDAPESRENNIAIIRHYTLIAVTKAVKIYIQHIAWTRAYTAWTHSHRYLLAARWGLATALRLSKEGKRFSDLSPPATHADAIREIESELKKITATELYKSIFSDLTAKTILSAGQFYPISPDGTKGEVLDLESPSADFIAKYSRDVAEMFRTERAQRAKDWESDLVSRVEAMKQKSFEFAEPSANVVEIHPALELAQPLTVLKALALAVWEKVRKRLSRGAVVAFPKGVALPLFELFNTVRTSEGLIVDRRGKARPGVQVVPGVSAAMLRAFEKEAGINEYRALYAIKFRHALETNPDEDRDTADLYYESYSDFCRQAGIPDTTKGRLDAKHALGRLAGFTWDPDQSTNQGHLITVQGQGLITINPIEGTSAFIVTLSSAIRPGATRRFFDKKDQKRYRLKDLIPLLPPLQDGQFALGPKTHMTETLFRQHVVQEIREHGDSKGWAEIPGMSEGGDIEKGSAWEVLAVRTDRFDLRRRARFLSAAKKIYRNMVAADEPLLERRQDRYRITPGGVYAAVSDLVLRGLQKRATGQDNQRKGSNRKKRYG